jgi:hypothetical protein
MFLTTERQTLDCSFVILSAGAGGNGIWLDCIAACDNRHHEALITARGFDPQMQRLGLTIPMQSVISGLMHREYCQNSLRGTQSFYISHPEKRTPEKLVLAKVLTTPFPNCLSFRDHTHEPQNLNCTAFWTWACTNLIIPGSKKTIPTPSAVPKIVPS